MSVPDTMLAAYVERLGGPEEIRYAELPTPRAGPTDVLVAVHATVVNRVDTFVRAGVFRTATPMPFVIGRDLVGTVVRAAAGAPGFAAGDRVWANSLGHGGRQGPSAQYALVPADRLYHLPAGVGEIEAVAVAHPTATAYLALFVHGGLRPGETVLVAGAAGNVGAALTVLARDAGATVLATARPADADYCRSLGASEVFDYADPSWPERARRRAPGGVDIFLDTYGINDLECSVELLARRGRIVLLAGVASRPVLPAGPLYLKDGSVRGFVISHAGTAELAAAAGTINRLLRAGRLRPRRVETLPLSAAATAHRRVEQAGLSGNRLVLRPEH